MATYSNNIKNRTTLKFLLGAIARFFPYLKYANYRRLARKRGAKIGENVILTRGLVKRANENLIIGDNSSIQTDKIDTRAKVNIGSNVIIGQNVEIITVSHNVDSEYWEPKKYGIHIEDYVWIATNALIMPSCTSIGNGAVIGGGAVVVRDIESMDVVGGNPAKPLRKRLKVHNNLVVPSLLGGDFMLYINSRKS